MQVPQRKDVIQAHRQAGGRVAAVFPIHVPRALFRAFEVLPVEVWGPPGTDTSRGDAHLQSYTCSIVRCGFSFLFSDHARVVDLVVVPHTCDSLQGLGSLLLDLAPPDRPVLTFYMPRNAGKAALDFLASELRDLYRNLAEITGLRPSDDVLMEAQVREEAADGLLGRLLEARPRIPLSELDFYRVVRSREYLPAEDFSRLAEATLDLTATEQPARIPLLVSGIVPEPMGILEIIAGAGGTIVVDDHAAVGRRVRPPGQGSDPFVRIASSLLAAPPDPTRGSPIAERADHLVSLARVRGVRGAIFHGLQFCEPELFDRPILEERLRDAGLRTLSLETDVHLPLPLQVGTRIEALLESLA